MFSQCLMYLEIKLVWFHIPFWRMGLEIFIWSRAVSENGPSAPALLATVLTWGCLPQDFSGFQTDLCFLLLSLAVDCRFGSICFMYYWGLDCRTLCCLGLLFSWMTAGDKSSNTQEASVRNFHSSVHIPSVKARSRGKNLVSEIRKYISSMGNTWQG